MLVTCISLFCGVVGSEPSAEGLIRSTLCVGGLMMSVFSECWFESLSCALSKCWLPGATGRLVAVSPSFVAAGNKCWVAAALLFTQHHRPHLQSRLCVPHPRPIFYLPHCLGNCDGERTAPTCPVPSSKVRDHVAHIQAPRGA